MIYGQRARDRAELLRAGLASKSAGADVDIEPPARPDDRAHRLHAPTAALRITDGPESLSLEADLQGRPG